MGENRTLQRRARPRSRSVQIPPEKRGGKLNSPVASSPDEGLTTYVSPQVWRQPDALLHGVAALDHRAGVLRLAGHRRSNVMTQPPDDSARLNPASSRL
eukprot:6758754-Pyramimonas_sp.AAC.1